MERSREGKNLGWLVPNEGAKKSLATVSLLAQVQEEVDSGASAGPKEIRQVETGHKNSVKSQKSRGEGYRERS